MKRDEQFLLEAMQELNYQQCCEQTWEQALQRAGYDVEKARIEYIQIRFNELRSKTPLPSSLPDSAKPL